MIQRGKQRWEKDQIVHVGFVRNLTVMAAVATPGDGLPDVYFLTNQAGDKLYEFTPHVGLRRIELEDAVRRMAEFRQHCERVAATEIARAAQQAAIRRKFNELFTEAG